MSDVAQLRFRNTEHLLAEFARSRNGIHELRGIETQFAIHLGITKNYWSALKTGKRHIGAILARQFEARAGKPLGWLDSARLNPDRVMPQGDEEWLAVGLLLTAYRASPASTRAALVELVGQALEQRPVAPPLPRPHRRRKI